MVKIFFILRKKIELQDRLFIGLNKRCRTEIKMDFEILRVGEYH